MLKKFVGVLLAITTMMTNSGLAALQSTNTIPSSGTIGPPSSGLIQESEANHYTASCISPTAQEHGSEGDALQKNQITIYLSIDRRSHYY